MKRFERLVFFLLLTTIPIQLGKHFWPNFAFVQGIRVDYLSPTLYVSDLLFLVLFVFSIKNLGNKLFSILKTPPFLFITFTLIVGSLFSIKPEAAIYGIIKFLEFFYIALYTSNAFRRKDLEIFTFIFTLWGLVETIILILQFISQKSLGGIFYYLGERTFNVSTPGISTFQVNGQLLLRPYGTFPHPNVLAFFLLFVFVVLIFSMHSKSKLLVILKTVALCIVSFGILLTFSRIVMLLFVGVILFWFFSFSRNIFVAKREYLFFTFCILLASIFVLFVQRFEIGFVRDVLSRLDLIKISFLVFIKNPLVGVGLNNFYFHEVEFQKFVSPTFLQPVHNIYLLWLDQTGILGAVAGILFLKKTFKSILFKLREDKTDKSLNSVVLLLCTSTLVIGLFDHYLLTLQQGQLLLSLLLGLGFSRIKD